MAKRIKDFLYSDILDIEKLLSLSLKVEKSYLYSNSDYEISSYNLTKLNHLIKRRLNGEPFAYLSGSKGFYDLDFQVTKDVLIPRPETELLIDIVLNTFNTNDALKILDLGTGSGAIAITLADKFNNSEITATDNSIKALNVAKNNAKITKNTLNFILSDWFEKIHSNASFDLIISNPPYIEENDIHLQELKFEPINALVAKDNGIKDIKDIIKNATCYLKDKAYLILEHGYNQQQQVAKLMQENNFINITFFQDLNGIERAVMAQFSKHD